MRQSLKGHLLPENEADYQRLKAAGGLKFPQCLKCGEEFSSENTSTRQGWAETQISGFCESCFDSIFAEPAFGVTQ